MNERIKQLLGQAYDEAVPETWTTLSSLQQGRIYEKFAELIVRECGVALSPMLRDMISRGQAYNLIKEHFGVRE